MSMMRIFAGVSIEVGKKTNRVYIAYSDREMQCLHQNTPRHKGNLRRCQAGVVILILTQREPRQPSNRMTPGNSLHRIVNSILRWRSCP